MLEVIEDTIIDSVRLIPFLFLTYLLMEYIEHKTKEKTKDTIKKSGKFGPFFGALLGIVFTYLHQMKCCLYSYQKV